VLKLTKKEYEVEEEVLLNDEKGEEIYKFKIQLTADELSEMKGLLFDEKMQEKVRCLRKLENEENYEELSRLEAEIQKENEETLIKFEQMVYKDHLDEFKEKAGKSYYDEMTEQIYSFFVQSFVDKRLKLVNTMNTNLRKAGMK